MSINWWYRPDSTLLHVMVSRLKCPFLMDRQGLCSFYKRETFCPFGHRSDRCNPVSAIPPYICVDYLVGKCAAKHTWKVPIKYDSLARCSTGYHPTGMQLLDLEVLDQKVTAVEPKQEDHVQQNRDQQDPKQSVEDDQKCAICLEQVHSPFGLLERCCHVFCGECIIAWQKTDRQKRCPICRVKSRRMLLWSNTEPIRNKRVKSKLFRLQAQCINLFYGGNQGMDGELKRAKRRLREAIWHLRALLANA